MSIVDRKLVFQARPCNGDDAARGRHLDAAVSDFEATGMSLSAIVVRRLRARSGEARTKAEALMRMQNISDPGAWSCVIAPGVAS